MKEERENGIYQWMLPFSFLPHNIFSFPPLSVLPKLKLSEHMTSPPGYLSESELISLMEKHSIGTVRCMEIRLPSLHLSH